MVLHRCTGQHDTVVTLQLHRYRRGLRTTVLYDMRLVKTDGRPAFLDKKVLHTEQQAVCGYDDITALCILYSGLSVFCKVQYRDIQRWCKLLKFGLPVWCNRCRSHNECRSVIRFCKKICYCLNCLSQSHIVSQQCPCAPFAKP